MVEGLLSLLGAEESTKLLPVVPPDLFFSSFFEVNSGMYQGQKSWQQKRGKPLPSLVTESAVNLCPTTIAVL